MLFKFCFSSSYVLKWTLRINLIDTHDPDFSHYFFTFGLNLKLLNCGFMGAGRRPQTYAAAGKNGLNGIIKKAGPVKVSAVRALALQKVKN